MSTGTLEKTGDSAFSTQVLGRFYGISRLAKGASRCYYTDTKRWYQCTGKLKAPKIIRAKTDPQEILLKDTSFAISHCEQGVWSNRKWGNQDVRYQNWTEMTLDDCWRNRQGSFLFVQTIRWHRKRTLPHGNAPTLSSYHRIIFKSTLWWLKTADSAFYTIFMEVICVISRLAKTLSAWYPDVTKKVIPNMVMTPAGWTFPIFRFT